MSYRIKGPDNPLTFIPAPSEPKVEPCCARCRRGMPSMGVMPCGFDGKCKCHSKKVTDAKPSY